MQIWVLYWVEPLSCTQNVGIWYPEALEWYEGWFFGQGQRCSTECISCKIFEGSLFSKSLLNYYWSFIIGEISCHRAGGTDWIAITERRRQTVELWHQVFCKGSNSSLFPSVHWEVGYLSHKVGIHIITFAFSKREERRRKSFEEENSLSLPFISASFIVDDTMHFDIVSCLTLPLIVYTYLLKEANSMPHVDEVLYDITGSIIPLVGKLQKIGLSLTTSCACNTKTGRMRSLFCMWANYSISWHHSFFFH